MRGFHRLRWIAVAAGIAAAIVLGVVLWSGQIEDQPAPASADQQEDPGAWPAPYRLDLSTGERTPLPETLAVRPDLGATYSRDATQVAVECTVPTCSGHGALEIAHADGTITGIPVPADSLAVTHAWSFDGTMLLYSLIGSSRDLGDLFVYDLDEGVSTQVTDLGLGDLYWIDLRADFTADGESVLFHRPRDGTRETRLDVWTVPVTGGEPTRVLRDAAQPEALDAPGRIAFVQPETRPLTGRTVVWAQDGGPRRTLFDLPGEIIDFQLSPDGARALVSVDDDHLLVDIATGDATAPPAGAQQWVDDGTLLIVPTS